MDSIIPLGHKNTLAEYMILSGADNRPPMLEKDLVAKDLWERVQLLMQGTSLTKQERECKLYDVFHKFTHIKGELLHKYYLRFTQLINDMNINNIKIEQFQVNTKFSNSLPSEWSKFMPDVKLVKDLHTTKFDQLHAYLEQHELHANEVRLLPERNQDPLAFVEMIQLLISIRHGFSNSCSFLKGRQSQSYSGTGYKSNATSSRGNNVSGHARIVKCYNCQGEGHMARQCTQPKRPRNASWYKDKAMLAEAKEAGQVMDEEKLAFLADLRKRNESYEKCLNLDAELLKSQNAHNDLLKRSKPTWNKKNDRISQTPSRNMKKKVEAQPRKVNKKNHVVKPIHNVDVKQSQLNANSDLICATCCPNCSLVSGLWMFETHDREPLSAHEFFSIFLGTVRFENDHIARILGGLRAGYEIVSYHISTLNDVVKSRNQTLVEAARTMLIFSKAPLFLWPKQSIQPITPKTNKTPYELMQDKKPDLSLFHVFGALCYSTNDNENLGKLDAIADISIFVGYAPAKKAFRIYNKRTRKIIETIHVTFRELTTMASKQLVLGLGLQCMTLVISSSGLVPNPILQQPCIPPQRDDWDRLFQPMFNEYCNPLTIVVSPVPVAAAPRATDLADLLVSTSIDQDAPSINSTSQRLSYYVRSIHTPFESLGRWTKDHPIINVIELKNFKQAMIEPSWIDAMQEETYEFKRLQV
uniref:CCHC-type domain-containing protein n=1 Tax=Tanacetum cinerariifolium TaxID=118510 RepID=A0A6L2LYI2_TANCI|nr:hypothetical protein [Tanacetum cinerariifolium]